MYINLMHFFCTLHILHTGCYCRHELLQNSEYIPNLSLQLFIFLDVNWSSSYAIYLKEKHRTNIEECVNHTITKNREFFNLQVFSNKHVTVSRVTDLLLPIHLHSQLSKAIQIYYLVSSIYY